MSKIRAPRFARTSLRPAGFTIVELMVATLVFSIILVVITSGVIHFTAAYYKGVNTSATQTAARNVATIIAQNLQYGGGQDAYDGSHAGKGYICVGSTRIDYKVGYQFTGSGDYGLVVSSDSCSHSYALVASSKEYLGPNMRVTNIGVTQVPGTVTNLYKISVGVAYGDIDLLCDTSLSSGAGSCSPAATTSAWANIHDGSKVTCKSGSGSQFCAVVHLNTEVVSRFGR